MARISVDLPEPGEAHDDEDFAGIDIEGDIANRTDVLLGREIRIGRRLAMAG